jgi:hypothetical protein
MAVSYSAEKPGLGGENGIYLSLVVVDVVLAQKLHDLLTHRRLQRHRRTQDAFHTVVKQTIFDKSISWT